MRRALAVTLALAAVAITLFVVVGGYLCGSRHVQESCFGAAECDAKSQCVSSIHPLSYPFVVLGAGGAVAAWSGRRDATLAFAVLTGGLATVVGLSIGGIELYAAAYLVAAGFALPPRDRRDAWLAWGALAAILLAVPVLMLVARLGHGSVALLMLTLFAPALAWLALAFATLPMGARREPRTPA